MKNSITPHPRTPRLNKRIGSARRTARWRENHPEHVDTRLVDRVLLEAAFLILTDGKTVPTSVTGRILPAIVEAAIAGLEDKGFRGADVRLAVGNRIRRHAEDRVVGRAVRIRKLMSTPIQSVSE